ncbi:hypothetical protein [Amnibacterium endophyticum]|uniref:Uncharacterized protein n=1 Tax=Amnibacterium endophyticum TaxID=2109337 RepID=A0ABW4LC55_9MICO
MDRDTPWDTDRAVLDAAGTLLESALRRQTWLFPLDDEHRALAAVAIDEMPVDPDPEDVARLSRMLGQLVDETGATAVVVAWERPGGAELRMQEADWVAALASTDAPVRAQLLVHDEGVRLLDPAFEALVVR